MSLITLPPAFPLVGLALSSTVILNIYQIMNVSKARKEAGVAYPNLYASDAEAKADPKKMRFNCAQRAHANTMELMPQILSMTGFMGIYHPKVTAILTFLWVVGRFGYTSGYTSGDPKKRINPVSSISYIGLFGLLFGSIGLASLKTYQYFF